MRNNQTEQGARELLFQSRYDFNGHQGAFKRDASLAFLGELRKRLLDWVDEIDKLVAERAGCD